MSEKYLLLNEELFIFDPETDDLYRVASPAGACGVLPPDRRALRLQALEVTRAQAEHVANRR